MPKHLRALLAHALTRMGLVEAVPFAGTDPKPSLINVVVAYTS